MQRVVEGGNEFGEGCNELGRGMVQRVAFPRLGSHDIFKPHNCGEFEWEQCGLLPMGPRYLDLDARLVLEHGPLDWCWNTDDSVDWYWNNPNLLTGLPEAVRSGCAVGFLPSDFLCSMRPHSFWPTDASGMLLLRCEGEQYNTEHYGKVRENFGAGGALRKFRDRRRESASPGGAIGSVGSGTEGLGADSRLERLILLEPPTPHGVFNNYFGGLSGEQWLAVFCEAALGSDGSAAVVYGDYVDAGEVLSLPFSLLYSRELNACRTSTPGKKCVPRVVCSVGGADFVLRAMLARLAVGGGESAATRTSGASEVGAFLTRSGDMGAAMKKRRDLDIGGTLLQILNPNPKTVVVYAKVLRSDVPYAATHPATCTEGGNVSFPAACAVISEILQMMWSLSADSQCDVGSIKVRFNQVA